MASVPDRRSNRPTGQAGFSLIELLISTAIFGLSMAALLGLQVATINGNKIASQLAEATYIGETFLANLGTLPTSDPLLRPGNHPMAGDLWVLSGSTTTGLTTIDLSACNISGNLSIQSGCAGSYAFEGGLGYSLRWVVIPNTIYIGGNPAPYATINLTVYWGGPFNNGQNFNRVQMFSVR